MKIRSSEPGYLGLLHNGQLSTRAKVAHMRLSSCDLCPWNCQIDRTASQVGFCRTAEHARVASYGAHMGEERVLTGLNGSGTIFFSGCNLQCQFCQNHDISQSDAGQQVDAAELASIMICLQENGCHNINLVSPSHVVAQIMMAIWIAAKEGLRVPIVYNTGGYDSITTLKLLEGIVDIYMPDVKYGDSKIAQMYSRAPNYPQINQAAIREMHRQVGGLELDETGLAIRGLLVRHLVLPENLAGTDRIVRFLATEISPNTYLNMMDQYHPAYNSHALPKLKRRIGPDEWATAVSMARAAGLNRLDKL